MRTDSVIKGRYQVRSVLGNGGMGVVYHAYDTWMRREVAVKILCDVASGVSIDLFYRECSALASMVHPNVVEVFDMGAFDENGISKPYFVMPLLPGKTLHALIYPARTPLSVFRVVDIISQCCRGLQAAHDRGLLHRDIKPYNIFVMPRDAVKVIDFGIAHLLGDNTDGIVGTLPYMSPEQISFKPLTNKSDVFSLATVAYEALTATHPFMRNPDRDHYADIARAITAYIPPLVSDLNPGVSRAVSLVIRQGMNTDPCGRIESAAAFAEALQQAIRNDIFVQTRLSSAFHSFEKHEYLLALKKVQEVLDSAPAHPEALVLNVRIEAALTEQKVLVQERAKARFAKLVLDAYDWPIKDAQCSTGASARASGLH